MDARVASTIGRVPIIIFGAADDVLGVGESRNPAPVDQLRVPTDMVLVQVGAHDIIDFPGLHARVGERAEEVGVVLVESGSGRPILVIAAAGVDQHRVAIGLHKERVVTHVDPAVRRQLALRQFSLTDLEHLGGQIRKKLPRRRKGALEFDDLGDCIFADRDGGHGRYPVPYFAGGQNNASTVMAGS